jgi:hypothetical protein
MADAAKNKEGGMDLREFVRDALVQICQGVFEAQGKSGTAVINPRLKTAAYDKDDPDSRYRLDPENLKNVGIVATNYANGHADVVEFDVAISVTSSKSASTTVEGEGKVEGKIYVASADVSLQGQHKRGHESSQSDVSRIRFRVPVQFPLR